MMKNRLHFSRSLRASEIFQNLQHLATFAEKQMYDVKLCATSYRKILKISPGDYIF